MILVSFENFIFFRHNSVTDEVDIPINNKVGTKRYMAPELLNETINEKHFDSWKRADVYSLGLVYWEIVRRCEDTSLQQDYEVIKVSTECCTLCMSALQIQF